MNRVYELVCHNGTAIFGQSCPTGQSESKIPVERNRNGPFHLTSDRIWFRVKSAGKRLNDRKVEKLVNSERRVGGGGEDK